MGTGLGSTPSIAPSDDPGMSTWAALRQLVHREGPVAVGPRVSHGPWTAGMLISRSLTRSPRWPSTVTRRPRVWWHPAGRWHYDSPPAVGRQYSTRRRRVSHSVLSRFSNGVQKYGGVPTELQRCACLPSVYRLERNAALAEVCWGRWLPRRTAWRHIHQLTVPPSTSGAECIRCRTTEMPAHTGRGRGCRASEAARRSAGVVGGTSSVYAPG